MSKYDNGKQQLKKKLRELDPYYTEKYSQTLEQRAELIEKWRRKETNTEENMAVFVFLNQEVFRAERRFFKNVMDDYRDQRIDQFIELLLQEPSKSYKYLLRVYNVAFQRFELIRHYQHLGINLLNAVDSMNHSLSYMQRINRSPVNFIIKMLSFKRKYEKENNVVLEEIPNSLIFEAYNPKLKGKSVEECRRILTAKTTSKPQQNFAEFVKKLSEYRVLRETQPRLPVF